MTRLCADCARPVSTGRTSGNNARCLICDTARLFDGWWYPASRKRPAKPPRPKATPAPRAERDRRYYKSRAAERKVRRALNEKPPRGH